MKLKNTLSATTVLLSVLSLFSFYAIAAEQKPADGKVTIIHVGTLLAIPGTTPQKDQTLVIRAKRIESINLGIETFFFIRERTSIEPLSGA